MKRLLSVLTVLAAAMPLAAEDLTLDPTLYAEALREAQHAASLPTATSRAQEMARVSEAAEWKEAMRDAGTELGDVKLLALLQRLNPQESPLLRAKDFAEVLRLHHLMLAGTPRACMVLSAAFRNGRFENGLLFVSDEALSALMAQRAAAFQPPAAEPERP